MQNKQYLYITNQPLCLINTHLCNRLSWLEKYFKFSASCVTFIPLLLDVGKVPVFSSSRQSVSQEEQKNAVSRCTLQ